MLAAWTSSHEMLFVRVLRLRHAALRMTGGIREGPGLKPALIFVYLHWPEGQCFYRLDAQDQRSSRAAGFLRARWHGGGRAR